MINQKDQLVLLNDDSGSFKQNSLKIPALNLGGLL